MSFMLSVLLSGTAASLGEAFAGDGDLAIQ